MGGVPHVRPSVRGPKKTGDPDFLRAALDTTACAAFSKESRMRCAEATKLHRKSGGRPTTAFAIWTRKPRRCTGNDAGFFRQEREGKKPQVLWVGVINRKRFNRLSGNRQQRRG
jgi:hypothetical protein